MKTRTGLLALLAVVLCAPVITTRPPFLEDYDGDGEFEVIFDMKDFDGDGSTYVTCTAKDAPISECKAAGEIIDHDFADDLNCALVGCGNGKMERTGTINLRAGVVRMNFPCRDGSLYQTGAGGTSDPTDRTTYDEVTDTGPANHCPNSQDGHPMRQISLAGWSGTIKGAGVVTEQSDTSLLPTNGRTGLGGTIIASDTGWGGANYHGSANTLRSFGFGFSGQDGVSAQTGTNAHYPSDSSQPGGWGVLETVASLEREVPQNFITDGKFCVCNSSGCTRSNESSSSLGWGTDVDFDITSITRDTQMFIQGNLYAAEEKAYRALVKSRVAGGSLVQGDCPSGWLEIEFVASRTGLTAADSDRVTPAGFVETVENDWRLGILREDYFHSSAIVEDVTFEAQDWWDEQGGDCAATGEFDTNTTDWGGTGDDVDCDEFFQAGFLGAGRNRLRRSAMKYWHFYGIDGAAQLRHTGPQLQDFEFMYGRGAPISDPGWGWQFQRIVIRDSQFSGTVLANFNNSGFFDDFKIINSRFDSFTIVDDQRYITFRDFLVENSSYQRLFAINCGAQENHFERIWSFGRIQDAGTTAHGMFNLECGEANNPIRGNTFINNWSDGPGPYERAGFEGTRHALFRFRVNDGNGGQDRRIYDNLFMGNRIQADLCLDLFDNVTSAKQTSGSPDGLCDADGVTKAVDRSCLFGVAPQSGGTGGGVQDEWQVFDDNAFIGNIGQNAELFCEFTVGGMDAPGIVSTEAGANTNTDGWCNDTSETCWPELYAASVLSRWAPLNLAHDPASECRDIFDTGGPPQTSGNPDGLCDADGTVVTLVPPRRGMPPLLRAAPTVPGTGTKADGCTLDSEGSFAIVSGPAVTDGTEGLYLCVQDATDGFEWEKLSDGT